MESYKFKPTYYTLFENGELNAVVPMMEVKSWITGKRAICLPFSDFCEPLFKDNSLSQTLTSEILNILEKKNMIVLFFVHHNLA